MSSLNAPLCKAAPLPNSPHNIYGRIFRYISSHLQVRMCCRFLPQNWLLIIMEISGDQDLDSTEKVIFCHKVKLFDQIH